MFGHNAASIFVILVLVIPFSLQSSPFIVKSARNLRQRNNFNKRPPISDTYFGNKHYNLNNEGWKPLYDVPNSVPRKHHKNGRPASKLPPPPNYISNYSQALPVYEESSKPAVPKNKKTQVNTRKKPAQYEVYENINEDTSPYDASQNRFRYQEIPLGQPVKSSNPFEDSLPAKHYQHVHVHEPSPSVNRYNGRTTVRSNRLSSTSRKPF